jgi:uncharacterized damage-inducible protein DinB
MDIQEQLIDTWRIHSRINLYLLDAIEPEALAAKAGARGRSVGEMFAHLHNVRRMWLEQTPELLKGIEKVEKEQAADKKLLRRSLQASAQALEALLKRSVEAGKVKGFKPHPAAFVGYAIAHEAYHHGEIGIALAQSGHPLERKVAYGMWEWGVR